MQFSTLARRWPTTLMWYKYIVKNVARKHGKTATFMPKPLFGDNGTGMHAHQSLWKDGKPLFAGDGYAGLSDMASATSAASSSTPRPCARSPTRRPTATAAWSPATRRRSTWPTPAATARPSIRIPMSARQLAKAKRIEFRSPDPTCNPYLAFAAMLMAGLDGIQNKIDPGDPLDKDIYDLLARGAARRSRTCPARSTRRSTRLEKDHEFLLQGDVFTRGRHRRPGSTTSASARSTPSASAPYPYEFFLYYDT